MSFARRAGALALLIACAACSRTPATATATATKTPPAAIEATPLAIGATAPMLDVSTTEGQKWSRPDGPALLYFYRGYW